MEEDATAIAAAEDWQATCMIYGGFGDEHETTTSTASVTTTTSLDNSGGFLRGSIVLTVPLDEYVFCRRAPNFDEQKPKFRFWTLHTTQPTKPVKEANSCTSNQQGKQETNISNHRQEQQQYQQEEDAPCLQFRLVFWGQPPSKSKTAPHVHTIQVDDDLPSYYSRVGVSLLSEYPHSFPQELKPKWIEWIADKANLILQEEQLSYSVCNFVEHDALLQFFDHLAPNLIFFQDGGPAFYNVPTLLPGKSLQNYYPLQRRYPNGSCQFFHDTSQLSKQEQQLILPLLQQWRDWLPITCPICFDTVSPQEASIATCDHGFCKTCLQTYLRIKADDLNSLNASNNPFICPLNECKRGMKIVKFVQPFLTKDQQSKVLTWRKDLKNPPCYSLSQCLKKNCTGTVLRKEAVDSYLISCEACQGRWCELCLQRAPRSTTAGANNNHHEETPGLCKYEVCVEFCQRYLAAQAKAKAACEAKFPWIIHYAQSRIHDHTITKWIEANGQVCPGCKTGIEREEGCFHMSCPCGTHFCYECGEQIFPPYYGTHHCWEREKQTQALIMAEQDDAMAANFYLGDFF